jgi:hypothetical protein
VKSDVVAGDTEDPELKLVSVYGEAQELKTSPISLNTEVGERTPLMRGSWVRTLFSAFEVIGVMAVHHEDEIEELWVMVFPFSHVMSWYTTNIVVL